MPSRRTQTGETPRRSERLRLQREAAASSSSSDVQAPASSSDVQAPRVTIEPTSTTSLLSIGTQSHAILAPRVRRRRWAGVDMARIRQVAADALNAARAAITGRGRQVSEDSATARSLSPTPEDAGDSEPSAMHTSSENDEGTPDDHMLVPPESLSSLVSFTVMNSTPNLLPQPPNGAECQAMMGRLKRELRDFQQDKPEGCTVEIVDDNIFHWRGSILGPPETPYTGGEFFLDLHFGHNYPFAPPKVFFLTKIFHCNIASNGYICLDILGREWSPALTVAKVLLSIRSLMSDPNPDDPLEPNIASMYKRHRNQHDVMASSWTSTYAKPGQEPPDPVYD